MSYTKFDPSKSSHQEYLEMFYHCFNYGIAETISEFASMGIIINPSQVV